MRKYPLDAENSVNFYFYNTGIPSRFSNWLIFPRANFVVSLAELMMYFAMLWAKIEYSWLISGWFIMPFNIWEIFIKRIFFVDAAVLKNKFVSFAKFGDKTADGSTIKLTQEKSKSKQKDNEIGLWEIHFLNSPFHLIKPFYLHFTKWQKESTTKKWNGFSKKAHTYIICLWYPSKEITNSADIWSNQDCRFWATKKKS